MRHNVEIDEAKAIKLHKQGMKVRDIAIRLRCKPPSIYRAFQRNGHKVAERAPGAGGIRGALFPPAMKASPIENRAQYEEEAIAAMRIAPRDPCQRCGVRGDIGCGCNKAPLGWRAA